MQLYSTWHRDKVELPPPPARIGIYTCGPTVYQRIHVGNARPFVLSMWLKRWLERRGFDVTLVENITDINDKIYNAAPGASAELAANAARWYIEDTDRLELGRPDVEPKATETIPEIIALIEELVGSGHAYEADGDVYFRVASFSEYGRLSRQRPDQMEPEEENPRKEDPRDFALWKANKPGEDTWWDSPWGRGRPGWHIECSAMAEKFLGPSFDIHMSGLDLVFPHHENEIAQSRAAGREFARIWFHHGMLEFTGEKMSKSLGNVVSLRDVLDRWGRETLLVYFLTGHWRSPIDFDDAVMEAAQAQVDAFRNAFLGDERMPADDEWDRIVAALEDDFNTAEALAIMHDWRSAGYLGLLDQAFDVFGLHFDRPTIIRESGGITLRATLGGTGFVVPSEVTELAEERHHARVAKDFERADELRATIEALGFLVRDADESYTLVPKE